MKTIDEGSVVAGRRMDRSIADFVRACETQILHIASDANSDNAVLGLLCDAVRLSREHVDSATMGAVSVAEHETVQRQAAAMRERLLDLDRFLREWHQRDITQTLDAKIHCEKIATVLANDAGAKVQAVVGAAREVAKKAMPGGGGRELREALAALDGDRNG